MAEGVLNKSMDRADLLDPEARPVIDDLNRLIWTLRRRGLFTSAWVGTVPRAPRGNWLLRLLSPDPTLGGERDALERGLHQRLNYQPLPGAADDMRIPWFLYWEIYWVLKHTRSLLRPGMRVLDAGGTASLFACYLASLGYELHAVDLNDALKSHADKLAAAMNWPLHSHVMDMSKLQFPDAHFDHAYSICVFEHLDWDVKQAALADVARCLKPGGTFSITFDYRNPAPGIFGYGKDFRPRNQLKTLADIDRTFLCSGHFERLGNAQFMDNAQSYLVNPKAPESPYTFGAIFLKKRGG